MRVGIIALLQESNTFISEPTLLEHFEQDLLLRGEQVHRVLERTHHEVGGFFEGLAGDRAVEAVPIFAARALPFGVIAAETFERLLALLFQSLAEACATAPLDGLLVAVHGATVSETYPDADGYLLGRLRRAVGSVPIICTVDLHANLSSAMIRACDASIAYRTNPHVDQQICGRMAADLMVRTLRGEVRPVQAACFPPLAIDIERQSTAVSPCRSLFEVADGMLSSPRLLSNSVTLGFPYADVAEMGAAFVAVADGDPALAQERADELAWAAWSMRDAFAGTYISVNEALWRAAKLPGPICLLDMGDNVGGGAPADSTVVAHALDQWVTPGRQGFMCIYDPDAVEQAVAVGPGATATFCVGGKARNTPAKPLEGRFEVVRLCDGVYTEPQPRHGGFTQFDQGKTAVLQNDRGLTLMVTSRRAVPYSLRQLTSCGVDPAVFHILVAKGVHAPIAAYEEVCASFIRVNTPGVTCADMKQLRYVRRRRPMYPFEPDTIWRPASLRSVT